MQQVEIFHEDEVNTQNLARLFKRAFIDYSVCDDGDLMVLCEGQYPVVITCEKDLKFLNFMCLLNINEAASAAQKLLFVNNINSGVIFSRFSLVRPNTVMADYFLPFEEGIPTFQIVSALKIFSRVVYSSVSKYDNDGIVLSRPARR